MKHLNTLRSTFAITIALAACTYTPIRANQTYVESTIDAFKHCSPILVHILSSLPPDFPSPIAVLVVRSNQFLKDRDIVLSKKAWNGALICLLSGAAYALWRGLMTNTYTTKPADHFGLIALLGLHAAAGVACNASEADNDEKAEVL